MKPTLANILKARQRLIETERAFDEGLLALPKQRGFKTAAELVEALRLAELRQTGKSSIPAPQAGKIKAGVVLAKIKESIQAEAPGKKPRKARVFITDEIRAKVVELVKAKKTNDVIATEVGLSTSTVQSIKEEKGLVARRGKQKNPAKK